MIPGNCGAVTGYGGVWCGNGALVPNRSVKISGITDGASNVIVIAEQSGKTNGIDLRSNYFGGWGGFYDTTLYGETVPSGSGNAFGAGVTTVRDGYPVNGFPNAGAPIGANQMFDGNLILNSFHTGGIHVLLGDGSVRFVSDSIDFTSLKRLCVRSDGGVVGEW
jgi:hypothetical protein